MKDSFFPLDIKRNKVNEAIFVTGELDFKLVKGILFLE